MARTRDLDQRGVGERRAYRLALTAVDAVVAKRPAVHAVGRPASGAVGTRPIAERERGDDQVAGREGAHILPNLVDDADELVTDRPEGMR